MKRIQSNFKHFFETDKQNPICVVLLGIGNRERLNRILFFFLLLGIGKAEK
jgi:hypothetical protein